ncbi:response regulator [Deferribacter abyssi]|uniref:response regulator n=1 Tax=Deferribacter abyssi TaxID=213806 RepID=UPI003C182213
MNYNLNNYNIMIIDDNLMNRIIVKDILESYNANIIEAENGFDGLKKLDKKIDVIILDANMPKMDGFEFVDRIRKLYDYKKLPIIMLTADLDTIDKLKSDKTDVSVILEKPVNPDILVHYVLNVLSNS